MLKLEDREWGVFDLGGDSPVVSIAASSSGIDKNKLLDDCVKKTMPYVTRSENNNGIPDFVQRKQSDKYKINSGNSITIGLDTQTVFFQPHAFYTGQNVQVVGDGVINKYVSFFFALSIKKQLSLLNWGGNGATLGRLRKKKILLPVTASGEPDYAFMEAYGKQLMAKKISEYEDYARKILGEIEYREVPPLNP